MFSITQSISQILVQVSTFQNFQSLYRHRSLLILTVPYLQKFIDLSSLFDYQWTGSKINFKLWQFKKLGSVDVLGFVCMNAVVLIQIKICISSCFGLQCYLDLDKFMFFFCGAVFCHNVTFVCDSTRRPIFGKLGHFCI